MRRACGKELPRATVCCKMFRMNAGSSEAKYPLTRVSVRARRRRSMRGNREDVASVLRNEVISALMDGREGRAADAAGDEFRVTMKSLSARTEGSLPVGPSLAISLSSGGSFA